MGTCQIIGALPALLIAVSAAFFPFSVPAQAGSAAGASFTEGEALFMRNKPAEAAAKLESALKEDPANLTAVLYLAIAYQQLARFDAGIELLRKNLTRAGEKTALFAFNLGNLYFAKGSASFAEPFYTKALEADPNFASALLNRANARIKTGALRDAVADYEQYLVLAPTTPQRPVIEKLIAFIEGEFQNAERILLAAAEAARAEEERRQRLLDEVAASLQASAEDTRGLSAGSEEVMGYDGEFVLE